LRIAANPIDAFMEPYYANDLGFFSKVGLNVEMMRTTNGAQAITAVVGGAVEIGISTVVQMANAYLSGVRLQFIAGGPVFDTTLERPVAALCVDKASTIKTPRDFEGKTIAVTGLRDGSNLGAAAFLAKNGVDLTTVKFIEMPFPAMPEALARGRVDGAMCAEPFMPSAENSMRVLFNAYQVLAPKFMAGGWFSSASWIKGNAAVAHRFAEVIYQTAKWANNPANHAERAAILQKYTRLDTAVLQRMNYTPFTESLDPAQTQPWLDWAYRLKYIDKAVRASDLIAVV
jgi:NitT/TauT family transport system substrate-binding protein